MTEPTEPLDPDQRPQRAAKYSIVPTTTLAKQFVKVLPPAKVIRFVQIENKLDTLLQLHAVANIPLAQ